MREENEPLPLNIVTMLNDKALLPNANLSLAHKLRRPVFPSYGSTPLLLFLHGYGSNEEDLMSLVPYMDERFFKVSARAPLSLTFGGFAWFHIDSTPDGLSLDPDEVEIARLQLMRFIGEAVNAYQIDPRQVYLLGFSQGAILGLSAALTEPSGIAGVVALSGGLLPNIADLAKSNAAANRVPIFVGHGTQDTVLPIHHGRYAQDRLSRLPCDLTYKEYEMGHEITPAVLDDTSAWLRERIDTFQKAIGRG